MQTIKPTLHTVLSPTLLSCYDVHKHIVVVIDVFRATSTIAVALYNGAQKIIPVDSVEECIRVGELHNAITAGERDGKVVAGLQYGNSPSLYTREFIENKILVFTTTNGTKLLQMAHKAGAEKIITGSFLNLDAVCHFLVQQQMPTLLACAAWKNCVNLEDTLMAGAIIEQVQTHFNIHCDSSLMAQTMYHLHKKDMSSFVRKTTHWQRLVNYGLESDLGYCIRPNVANVLPIFVEGALVKA